MGKKYDGSLVFDTHISTKEFENGISKIKGMAKTGAVAIGAASAAIGAVGTAAIKAYADYEQLVGGVDTLFKDSSKTIQKYADEAYKTAGMSANKYMETVTSFSASLLQSLGGDTAKSAEYANQAVIDMSDNANKMGTNIQSIQDAYQGFAKQNYTMLDNLKLGYGGTATEMARLLNDSGVLGENLINLEDTKGIGKALSDVGFAKITEAIHAVQTEMGITGTTAKEAATAIQGSLGMLKGSWENLMTGLTDPSQDLDALIQNVFDSLITAGENLMPRIEQVLSGICEVVTKLAPPLIEAIGNLIPQLLPAIIQGIDDLGASVVIAVGNVLDGIGANLSERFPRLSGIFENLTPIVAGLTAAFVALKTQIAISGAVSALTTAWTAYKSANTATPKSSRRTRRHSSKSLKTVSALCPTFTTISARIPQTSLTRDFLRRSPKS